LFSRILRRNPPVTQEKQGNFCFTNMGGGTDIQLMSSQSKPTENDCQSRLLRSRLTVISTPRHTMAKAKSSNWTTSSSLCWKIPPHPGSYLPDRIWVSSAPARARRTACSSTASRSPRRISIANPTIRTPNICPFHDRHRRGDDGPEEEVCEPDDCATCDRATHATTMNPDEKTAIR